MSLNFQEVPFGPLQGNGADEKVPFGHSLVISDCIIDNDQLETRPGYRGATVSALTGANGTTVQELYRFRPSRTSAKTVGVVGGGVNTVTDPSSETATDGTISLLASPFADTAIVSAAQLNANCYLATDEANVAWRRIKSDYTLQTWVSIAQGALPAFALGSPAWVAYRAAVTGGTASVTGTNCVFSTTVASLLSDWYGIVGTTGDASQPATGAIAKVTLTTAVDITGADWMAVAVSPPDSGTRQKNVVIEVSSDNAVWYPIGTIHDVPPVGGSPNLIFCKLDGVPDSVKAAFKYIRYTVNQGGDAATLRYALYGHMVIYGRRPTNPAVYYVDFYDSSNVVASPLTLPLSVKITDDASKLPTYTDEYITSDAFANTASKLGPLDPANIRLFNGAAGLAIPTAGGIGVPVTISGNAPAGYSGTLVPRLWLDTTNGRRLVTSGTAIAAGAAYSLVDNGGNSVLTNQLYKANGSVPRASALAASAGRLISGYENRLSISSYTPTSDNTNPFPQFPDIPIETADGWSFDFVSKAEAIQCIIGEDRGADATYVMTQMTTRYIKELDAPLFGTPPIYTIINRGALGPHAAGYWEGRLFVASYDGIYMASGRRFEGELTAPIRAIYIQDFVATNAVCLGYNITERALYAVQGTKVLRCSFLTDEPEWSGPHTLNDTIKVLCGWIDPTAGAIPQMWMFTSGRKLGRLQASATRDLEVGTDTSTGAALPNWSFSTGFDVKPQQSKIEHLYADVSGDETEVYTSSSMLSTDERRHTMPIGETTLEGPGDMKAYKWRLRITGTPNTVVRRIMWDREGLDAIR